MLARKRLTTLILTAGLALIAAAPAGATTLPSGFAEADLTTGYLNSPTAAAFAPDGRKFLTEKGGRVRVVSAATAPCAPPRCSTSRAKVNSYSDRGLLGIATDKDFATNGYLYLLYVYELNPMMQDTDAPMVSRLTRVTVKPDNTLVNPSNPETVILGTDVSGPCEQPDNLRDCIPADYKWHTIGTVRSDPVDGTLWVGNGDTHPHAVNSTSYRPYDEQTLAGKIIHIDRNGRGLPGHPFCPTETDLTKTCTKIYAKGFRNPFRFNLRPGKGPVVGDVGANDREEIDLIKPGQNYGWPCYEGTIRTPLYRTQSRCLRGVREGGHGGRGHAADLGLRPRRRRLDRGRGGLQRHALPGRLPRGHLRGRLRAGLGQAPGGRLERSRDRGPRLREQLAHRRRDPVRAGRRRHRLHRPRLGRVGGDQELQVQRRDQRPAGRQGCRHADVGDTAAGRLLLQRRFERPRR